MSAIEQTTPTQDALPELDHAVGHLADISTALHSISYELEQLRLVVAYSNQTKHIPIHTREGDLTFPEWVNRGFSADNGCPIGRSK